MVRTVNTLFTTAIVTVKKYRGLSRIQRFPTHDITFPVNRVKPLRRKTSVSYPGESEIPLLLPDR